MRKLFEWFKQTGPKSRDNQFQALCETQKVELLDRLTTGVAQDFNNLLTVILGNATFLRINAEARSDSLALAQITVIQHAAERGGRLASQLLALSRNQPLQPIRLSVYQVFSAMRDLLAQAAGDTIRVLLSAEPALRSCTTDRGQLESAILNLVLNARDEMPVGGDIAVSCRGDDDLDGRRFVRIDVTDSGNGIAVDLQDRVFEPFFSTKQVPHSGLGLTQVKSFIEQSGGRVALTSRLGAGTTVSLWLPADDEPLPDEAPGPETLARGDQQTVLLVEPDSDLATAMGDVLTQANYLPLTAATASGALTYLVSAQPIDLMISESCLPGGISGGDLARNARHLRPQLRTVLTSSAYQTKDQIDPESVVLIKPYRLPDLTRIVAGQLAQRRIATETDELLNAIDRTTTRSINHQQRAATSNAVRLGIAPLKCDSSAFALGLAEEIIKAFAPFRWITCVASACHSDALNLDFLLEGSVKKKQPASRSPCILLTCASRRNWPGPITMLANYRTC